MNFVCACYEMTKLYPRDELFGLVSQIRRAAVSVPANIAEGQGRHHTRGFLQHLGIAKGSVMEVETHLLLSHRVGLITEANANELIQLTSRIGQMLSRLKQSLEDRIAAS